jgi:hypothetical protein
MAAQLADNRPFECFQQWEWEWLRQDLSVTQIEEGLTKAFECNPDPSHSLIFGVLEAARSRVEAGLPPYGNLWEEPSKRGQIIEASRKRASLTGFEAKGGAFLNRAASGGTSPL